MQRIFMSNIFMIIIFSLTICNCESFTLPKDIPTGKWDYKLNVNGRTAGTASMTNQKKDGKYITSSEFKMSIEGVNTVTRESITETLDFKPVRLESYNKIESGKNLHESIIKASFDGRKVEVTANNKKNTYHIKKHFILDGNYTLSKLIAGKFKTGMEVKAQIYHPSIELEDPIFVKTSVIGVEGVEINGRHEKLMHVAQSVEEIKSIDIYFGNDGVVKKILIQMLNLKIELIIKS